MSDPEIDSERDSPRAPSEAGATALMAELARAPRVAGALGEMELPTPLRGLVQELAVPAHDAVPELGALIDGRYRLESVLGSGGMGVVFAARHVQTDKPVALKWLSLSRDQRGSRDRAQALARFAREARAGGRIRHPNVVDVYDASSEERAPYLVMERLEGETLRARIERTPLSWEELVSLLLPALRGVAELHRQGIVHRDLKPDNVFLARAPGAGEQCAKVLDFGVSMLRSLDAHEDSLTGTGAIVGTPSYMPLEQLRGAEDVDERTDVYALGVVLFEALTGRRPWQARSAGEYGALLASTRPTRLSVLRPELKGAREAAIMKALEREPAQRHASVEAFIVALESACRPRPYARYGPIVALGLVLLLALLLARAAWPSTPPRTAAKGAVAASALVSAATQTRPAPEPAVESGQPALPSPPSAPESGREAARERSAKRAKLVQPMRKGDRLEQLSAPPEPNAPAPKDYATELARDDF
jgi:serine/threonine-protein kinase